MTKRNRSGGNNSSLRRRLGQVYTFICRLLVRHEFAFGEENHCRMCTMYRERYAKSFCMALLLPPGKQFCMRRDCPAQQRASFTHRKFYVSGHIPVNKFLRLCRCGLIVCLGVARRTGVSVSISGRWGAPMRVASCMHSRICVSERHVIEVA